MPETPLPQTMIERRSPAFLLAFALANAGGVLGYLPLLSLLLPVKIEAIAGEARLDLFTATVIAGALSASVSNILFGWLSDRAVARGGGRRAWMAGGVAATALSYVLIVLATSPLAIVLAIVAFQFAVNAMLAPLLAVMADEIPDSQKGVAGGLLQLAQPVAAAVCALLVGFAIGEAAQMAILAGMIALLAAPLLATRSRPLADQRVTTAQARLSRRDLAIAWVARLLIQVSGAVLSLYLFYYFESLSANHPADLAARVAQVLTAACVVTLPIAVLTGRFSDRIARRKPFLMAMAALAAAALLGMAWATSFAVAALCFGLFTIGQSVFLALHSAFAMQLLPDPRRRGRDLGLINLTNTFPSLLGPLLAWMLATPRDFDAVMLTLAALTLGAGMVIFAVREGPRARTPR